MRHVLGAILHVLGTHPALGCSKLEARGVCCVESATKFILKIVSKLTKRFELSWDAWALLAAAPAFAAGEQLLVLVHLHKGQNIHDFSSIVVGQ